LASVKSSRHLAQSVAFFVALVVLWEVLVRNTGIKQYLLPPPTSIADAAWSARQIILQHTLVTLNETIWGFVIGTLSGAALAILIFGVPVAWRTLYPLIIALQSVPKVALAPLLIVWFGYGVSSKVVMSLLIAFFPVVIGVLGGLSSVPANLVEHFRSLGSSGWTMFWYLRLPSALPSFIDSCKIAMPLAVIGAVTGEFVGSEDGLGNLILLSSNSGKTALTFAALVAVTILSMMLYAMVELLGRLVWWRMR
jgi:NitT/TauT family transport system permease protein